MFEINETIYIFKLIQTFNSIDFFFNEKYIFSENMFRFSHIKILCLKIFR